MSRKAFMKEDDGQAIILIAITFLGLLMAVGLAIDTGQLFVARRTMQEAADSAAYAGAVVKYQGGTTLQARQAAVDDATRNGFTCELIVCGAGSDTPNGINVTVNAPPLSGTYVGNTSYVEVLISGSVRTALVPAQSGLTSVSVRGVAGAGPLNNGFAIMALDRGNTQKAFYADNQADIHLTGGGILVNSTNSAGAWSDQCNTARFTIAAPYGTYVAGGGSGCFPTTGDGLDINYPQQADPLSGYSKPSTTGMTTYNSLPGCSGGCTIDPGIWTTSIGGAGGTTINLNPGIYVLKGQGINAAGNADLVGSNVFIFNTHSNYPGPFRPGVDSCGSVNLSGNSTSTLNAMTSAYVLTLDPNGQHVAPDVQEWNYVNFLVYQDPACTNQMQIAGNGVFTGTGTIYVPTATFVFSGNNATLTGSQLIAKVVNIQSGNININFDAGNTAQPVLPRLSE